MNLSLAKTYFDEGLITGFDIIPDPLTLGRPGAWILSLSGSSGRQFTYTTARGETRSFRTVESALETIRAIGMRVSALSIAV